ncbi:cache domain-containing protein [Colwellia sp. TT2012]|uniref:cache domain-containing protein n=1 Tax=Colwellia sp. TT2012 TaxID=1720342 RepID=UPI000A85B596|nr:cache domain-containing protein [Colwellia sp. TT2012]
MNLQDKSAYEIKLLISDALRDIRFNKGRGYFFIYQSDGFWGFASYFYTVKKHQLMEL